MEEIRQSLFDLEFPRFKKRIPHLGALLQEKKSLPLLPNYNPTLHKRHSSDAGKNPQKQQQQSRTSYVVLDQELIKSKIKQKIVLSEIKAKRKSPQPIIHEQNQSISYQKPKIIEPILTKVECKIKEYLMNKKRRNQPLTPSDELFLKQILPQNQLSQLLCRQKTVDSGSVVYLVKTQMNLTENEDEPRGLTPGKWLVTGRETNGDFMRNYNS